ncbi:MAG: amidohydrolase [Flavobacteriaceae bacterium]|jgi:imidazolonepropionase-like amidohydrolase|nr:amidohydrolase [Flavobacteriaceae bacterium]|tara:strand:- start:31 stop:1308 length:1278 start_codon:yes stop_codon:yes gene_type:complete
MKKFLFIIFYLIFIRVHSQHTYIYCGNLFDSKSGKILKNRTIIIENEKIFSVEKGFKKPKNKNINLIDLKSKTVMPGLIDMHVHIEGQSSKNSYLNEFTLNDSDIAYDAAIFANRTLMAGFTTVRDVGGRGVNVALRNAINQGKVSGPRIFTAEKAIGTTGGHADPTNGYRNELIGDPGPKDGVINSIEDAKKAVRQRYKNGADLIKITATGGVLSMAENGENPQFTVEEIKEIVNTAKDYGMHVAAHAHGDEGMYRAVLAGVRTIEHGTLMSERTMDLMIEKNAYLVPTMTAGKSVVEKANIPDYYPDIIVPKALKIGPVIQKTFSKAYSKGVRISFGTDAGVFDHGLNAKEFIYMVEAGMPETEAIQSATITNALILDKENVLGQISKGFFADIIATNDNPLDNINTLTDVIFVMKNGSVYKN